MTLEHHLPKRNTGLLVSLEKSGYAGQATARISSLLPGWGVKKARRMGASAVKLLVYFRPDLKEIAARQLDLVAGPAETCLKEDIALLVEPVSYPVESDKAYSRKFAAMKPELVIETARQITALPVDVLKAEFPADLSYEQDEGKLMTYCQELNKASRLPWVLLSAGVNFELFKKEVTIASQAGASGFLAGRALWQESVKLRSREERAGFFKHTAAPRLRELAGIARRYGKPWYIKMGAVGGEFAPVAEGWYRDY